MSLFQSESSDRSEKFLPRVAQIAKVIFFTYLFLTVSCFLSLFFLKVGWFDALCHSMTTISTGGFSTHDASIGFFKSAAVEYVLSFFMWTGGVTQLLFGYFLTRNWQSFFRDDQVKAYIRLTFFFVILMTGWNLVHQKEDVFVVITKSFFNVLSAITTTGFSSSDYSLWGGVGWMVFFVAPFIGGCTGSTSGGIKVFRFQILWRVTSIHLKKLRRPHGIFLAKYNGKQLSESVFDSVSSFVMLFAFCYFILCFTLTLFGLDFSTALSAAGAMLTNLGPGLGNQIGPAETYAGFIAPIKWILWGDGFGAFRVGNNLNPF
ncbi:MAG: TrkH family potassium uptake protein [Holosporaceae bacterium]|nr:MAG: TrkH family potassium uptake protein [Holosporaceae bacterium]